MKFGPDGKDLVDIFVGDKGPSSNRTVLIYIPGGGGNKIEQQSPESNAFYDNIGRFMERAQRSINGSGAFFSADVFGYAGRVAARYTF